MKILKNNFIQKLIIVLALIMIFNLIVPKQIKALDIAGILFKPIFTLIATLMATIDITLGCTLFLTDFSTRGVNDFIDAANIYYSYDFNELLL